MLIDYSLYLILNAEVHTAEVAFSLLEQIVAAGITCVQLRMKNTQLTDIIAFSKKCGALLKSYNIPLIINDCWEAVIPSGAQGVHLGQRDANYCQVRAQLSNEKIIGLSIENSTQARACQHYAVDYFGVGPVFATSSKADAAAPLGLQNLQNIVGLLSKPVVAIGGINLNNVTSILQAGVMGIAVIAAITEAPCAVTATRTLSRQISDYRKKHHASN